MIYHMDIDGRIAAIFPDGVLYRKGSEAGLRREFVEKLNIIDAVIALPANLFVQTGVKTSIIVCKKDRSIDKDNILFIDGTDICEQHKQQNIMKEAHVSQIAEIYQKRRDVEEKARVVSIEEIRRHGFNLHVSEYVSPTSTNSEFSISEITARIYEIDKEIDVLKEDLKETLAQLSIDFPF